MGSRYRQGDQGSLAGIAPRVLGEERYELELCVLVQTMSCEHLGVGGQEGRYQGNIELWAKGYPLIRCNYPVA